MDSFLRYMDPDVDGVVTLEELHMGMRRARMDEKTLKEEQRAGGIMLRLEAIIFQAGAACRSFRGLSKPL